MNRRRNVPPAVREAAIRDYYADPDVTAAEVAARYGIARSTFSGWVNGIRDDVALTGGHWGPNSRGVQVWQPCFFNTIHECNINHQENTNAA